MYTTQIDQEMEKKQPESLYLWKLIQTDTSNKLI